MPLVLRGPPRPRGRGRGAGCPHIYQFSSRLLRDLAFRAIPTRYKLSATRQLGHRRRVQRTCQRTQQAQSKLSTPNSTCHIPRARGETHCPTVRACASPHDSRAPPSRHEHRTSDTAKSRAATTYCPHTATKTNSKTTHKYDGVDPRSQGDTKREILSELRRLSFRSSCSPTVARVRRPSALRMRVRRGCPVRSSGSCCA